MAKQSQSSMRIHWHSFATPIGPTYAAISARGLCRLTWLVSGPRDFELELALLYPDHLVLHDRRPASRVSRQLAQYFAGRRRHFELDLDLSTLSNFERRVLQATSRIPFGTTASYAQLARRIHRPTAARAVGNALRKNPLPIVIPCHRVIRSDGSPGGYSGRTAVDHKLRLLRHEGANLDRL
ncbi:MAG: methylated-DNA--[protein]-cysteine S-methyltransferase [Gemmatimonadota bacterium]|nr:MAG: methylated-DNA--[protein]-cysteine S-methyltransferase [Gemmatimonadota bacterium]